MKHILKLGLVSMALVQVQLTSAEDLPTYRLDDVVVTATRTPQSPDAVLGDVSVITTEQIRQAGQSTLVELLQTQSGVEIVRNGGLGTNSDVFLRGADKTHTLVLIDGMRINSATNGTTAFANIPLDQIERIEILRGPASHLYGSEAVGGVIQVFTKRGKGVPRPNFSLGVDSYNTQSLSGGVSGEVNDTRFSVQVGHIESDGFSAFSVGNAGYLNQNQDKDGYRNSNLSVKLAQTLGMGHEIGINVFESNGRNHYDSGASASTTRTDYFQDQILSAIDVYSKNRVSSNWQSLLRLGVGTDHLNSYSPTKSVYNTDQNQFAWQNDIAVGNGQVMLGVERLDQKVDGITNYAIKSRTIQSYFTGYQGQAGGHSYQLNLRSDDNSQFGRHNTGFLGYGYQIAPRWQVGGSVSTAFKAPTFNNLYYPGPTYAGNPNLNPEKARNKEAFLRYSSGGHHFSAVVFDNQITDLINVTTTPVSQTQRAEITGTSFSYQGELGDYRLRANLDLQDPTDQSNDFLLLRRARQHATLGVRKRVGEWDFGGEWLASSYRYDDSANTKHLGGYGLVSLTAGRSLSGDWSVLGRINNLFDKQYELVQGYNTPGLNLFVTLRYQPTK